MKKNREIKFAAMADIHLDIMHDGERRLDAFLAAADSEDADFVIHLGDFAYPNDTSDCICPPDMMPENVLATYKKTSSLDKEAIIKKYNAYHKPAYHTLGNHDFDFLSPEGALALYGIERGYYSFHTGGWHFIVLDANYYKDGEGNFVHYDRGGYFYQDLPYLSDTQLVWLKDELKKAPEEPVIIFSHQPLFKYSGCIKNLEDFEKIIADAKANGKQIRMCINGHCHVDDLEVIDGTVYYNLNSISNYWVGENYTHAHYGKRTEEKFPCLKWTIPYRKPVYAIITLNDEGVSIKGVKGSYVSPGPKALGYRHKVSPSVKSRDIKWK